MTVVVGVLIAATPVRAVAQSAPPARGTSYEERWSTSSARRVRAAELLTTFRRIDRELPTLSPSEALWLKTEYDDELAQAGNRFTARSLAVLDSREYQIRVVRRAVAPMLNTLAALASEGPIDSSSEARLWTIVAVGLIDQQLWQSVGRLVKLGLVGPEINGFTGLYFESHSLLAREILGRVVIPLLGR